jgi:Phospholipase B
LNFAGLAASTTLEEPWAMGAGLFKTAATSLALTASLHAADVGSLTPAERDTVGHGRRFDRAGWIHLHIEGDAAARGFQHGWLLAPEISECLRVHRAYWEYDSGVSWSWLVARGSDLLTPKLDPENLAEIDGIVSGLAAAGVSTSRAEIITYNAFLELSGYWWPKEKKALDRPPGVAGKERCSAFVATGDWTADGGAVLGHNTMFDYVLAVANVVVDIAPSVGHRILMQTQPGWVHSGTDFFITDAGLGGCETTIGQFNGFDTNGVAEFARFRRATQDASTIDQWRDQMVKGNNGGYANAWLLADFNTGEIARLELGLKRVAYERTTNGYFAGSNVAEDKALLRFETDRSPTDIRRSAAARRVRWKELIRENKGRITADLAKRFLADYYDVCLRRRNPGSRTLCGHFELDPETYGGPEPFEPSGTFDGKVVDRRLGKAMTFLARWGSADGLPFRADKFLKEHPQYDWQEGLLKDRPAQPWVSFKADE